MKNISRRVFIKGMAVAAVATAASTVLTGCKLPVGPQEPEVVPTPANTLTYTDGDNTLTISAPKYITDTLGATDDTKENVIISMNVDNKLGKGVEFETTIPDSPTTADNYCAVVTAKYWAKNGVFTSKNFENGAFVGYTNVATGSYVAGKNTFLDNGCLVLKDMVADDWTKVVVTVEVFKAISDGQDTPVYYYNKDKADAKAEFTFNK